MKELKKISLTKLAKNELENRELNKLLGGETCCICGCGGPAPILDNAAANNAGDQYSSGGGYGNGSFN